MYARRRDGAPVWISRDLGSASFLKRVNLQATSKESYDEAWLQELMYRRKRSLYRLRHFRRIVSSAIAAQRTFAFKFYTTQSDDAAYQASQNGIGQ